MEELGGSLSNSAEGLYAFLPQIRFLGQPEKSELQKMFGDSVGVIWAVMTGIGGLGLLASLLMKNIPLQNVRDEKWTNEDFGGGTIHDGDIEDGVRRGQATRPKGKGKVEEDLQITVREAQN